MKHCWHREHMVLSSDPPDYRFTCCHCGERWTQSAKMESDPNHGKFVQQVYRVVYPSPPETECPSS